MEADQDIDDDTHICLKCRTTITGLDNYVKHRKAGCSASVPTNRNTSTPVNVDVSSSIPKNDSSSPAHEENDPNLKADDFFSSLELQSSAKKTGTSPGASTKNLSGVLTRSRATAAILANTTSREVQQSVKSDSELLGNFSSDHFDTSANSCLIKPENRDHIILKVDDRSDQEESGCEEDSNDDYEDDDEEDYDDTMHDECPPRSHTGGKWKPGGLMTRGSPPSWTRTSSSSTHAEEYRSGEWSLLLDECPSSSAVTTETAAPPPHFTGGKWKPSLTNQTVISTSQVCRLSHSEEEEDIIQETDSNTRRLPSTNLSRGPPPGHTSGKWVPGKHVRLGEGSGGSGNSGGAGIDNMLLMPPLRKSGSTIQYWCGPCNRRLSSRTLYERHLLSELHFKRTLQERELEEDLGQNELDRGTDKRQVKSTEIYLNSEIWPRSKRKRLISGVSSESPKRQKRQSHSREICCEVCSSKVWPHLLGKHLVSHYHCRKARSGHPEAMRLVLDNIHSVVKQAPFQCSPCKFYCNTMSSFRQHWTSIEHQEIDRQMTGRFWCSICKYECENSVDIEGHLESIMHRELVSVINRSVPIVIRKLCVLNCGTCGMEFRYNIQLRYHGLRTGHQELNTASDEYQERFPCSECHFIGSSCSSLQRHVFHAHKSESSKKGAYFCGACSLNFDTAEESAQHRRSQEHKYTALASRKERGLTEEDLSKSCPHCGGNFDNVLLLKAHLREQHSEFPYRCPRCGMAFTLPQEVSRHVRERACIFPPEELKTVIAPGVKDVFEKDVSATEHLSVDMEDVEEIESTKDIFACNQCPYKTDSKAELLFHEVLHSEPILGSYTPNSQMARYQCPICTREFRKSALRSHLRTHTDERPFVCSICYRGFGHRSSMIKHVKQTHMAEAGHSCDLCPFKTPNKATLERHRLTHTNRNKPFLCAVCGASFFLKNTLQQHMKVHTGKDIKCKFEGCIFSCRSQAELRNHQQVHSEDRPYQCDTCTYSAKTKPQLVRHQTVHLLQKPHQCPHCPFSARMASHLRRHLRLHTGAKPYRCPYCSYTCNILENLRKHVLSTSKHPGKQLYECRFCDSMDAFKTNLAKDFRAHLVTSHPDHFGSAMLAASYVAGIYDANEDPKYIDKPIKIQPRWRQNKSSTATFDHDCLAKPRKEETQQLSATSTSEELGESTKEEVFDRVGHKKGKAIREPTLSMSSSVTDNIQHDQNQELLSMVVVTDPNDVIYIQIPPDPEGEAMERYCESVLFPNEGDAFLSVEHLNKRRSSGGDRSTSSNSIGCETTIMLPLGVDEVEELQEVEEIKDNEHMVVIKGNPNEQHQEGNSDEELTIIKIPPSTSGVSDFLRFPHVSHHDLGEATTSQDLERLGLHISPEVTENEHREDDPIESAEDIDPNQQEQRYVVILK